MQIRTLFFMAIMCICLFVCGMAQNKNNTYNLDQKAVTMEVVDFDTIAMLFNNHATTSICIEKKWIDLYIDQDSSFYEYWEFYPNSYAYMDPAIFSEIVKYDIIPSLTDTSLIRKLSECFYSNGFPKHHNLLGNKNKYFYKNVDCINIGAGTFLVLLVPYSYFFDYRDSHVHYDPAITKDRKQLPPQYADALYIKAIYPISIYNVPKN